jgi:HEAT repeat protein
MQGLLLCPDPARHALLAFRPERRDATFAITEQFDLIRSDDPQFIPTRALIAPDGAIYLATRPEAGQPGAPSAAGKRTGRLYRLTWAGGPAHPALPPGDLSSWTGMVSLTGADLVKKLASVHGGEGRAAQQELLRRGPSNKAALIQALHNRDLATDAKILAAGALCAWWDDEIKNALIKLATDDDAALRRIAAECLCRNSASKDPKVQEVLLYILGDPDPSTRRSVALAMARVGAPEAADCLATALSFDIGGDACLRDGLVRALEFLGKPGLERLLALANSGEDDRLELAAESFCALRSPAALALLPQLLDHPHLRTEQRVRLVRSLARYENPRFGDFSPIIRQFAARPPVEPEVWLALLEVGAVRFAHNPGGFVRLFFTLMH